MHWVFFATLELILVLILSGYGLKPVHQFAFISNQLIWHRFKCFYLILLMVFISFIKCVFTHNDVLNNPPLIIPYDSNDTNTNTNININDNTYCQTCNYMKPQRTHHCRICQKCILKMDHHCPWISNCVGYYNYKYFCLFIWYSTLGAYVSCLISFSDLYIHIKSINNNNTLIHYSGNHPGWLMINSLLTLSFGITLTCFSVLHIILVSKTSTVKHLCSEFEFETETESEVGSENVLELES